MRRLVASVSIAALSMALAVPVRADDAAPPVSPKAAPRDETKRKNQQPALMTADQVIYDRDLDTVTASGHVEIDQSGRILLADAVSYNIKQDVIIATGNVSFTDIDGEVHFADYIELSGDMKQATARHLRMLMVDNSRFAAVTARRTDGNRDVLDNAIYTPCAPCADDPNGPPLWDLRAKRIVHDDTTHRIAYDDVWLDADGIPVVYLPYFSHADPTVKRESGLVPPTFFNNKIVGTGLSIPYYQIISPYQDATIAPLYTSAQGLGGAATWRARSTFGEMTTAASFGREPELGNLAAKTTGWDINAKSQFAIDDYWRTGWDIQRASDRDYLRYYDYPLPEPYLTTRPYLEGFGNRDYASLEAFAFQNQTDIQISPPAGVPNKTPMVVPRAVYSVQTQPGWADSYWTIDTQAVSLLRADDETNTRRVNTLTAWHLPFITDGGQVVRISATLRVDAYDSDHIVAPDPNQTYAYRVAPTTSIDWRFPLARFGEHSVQTLTPIVVGNLGPYGGNSDKIPNEDSLDFNLDDSNIFDPSPATGYDRVATGPRIAYGGEYAVSNRGAPVADVLVGQSYQKPVNLFPVGTGLDHDISDLVGRAIIVPSSDLSIGDHFRLAGGNLQLRRNETNVTLGSRPLSLTIGYAYVNNLASGFTTSGVGEQILGSIKAQLSRHWSGEIYDTSNIGPGAGPLQSGARVSYEDECTILQFDAGIRHTTVNTVVTGHYAVLRIVLKTLGQFPVNLF